ncbi:14496_t:CDS:1, partial [Gigaspora rosea]
KNPRMVGLNKEIAKNHKIVEIDQKNGTNCNKNNAFKNAHKANEVDAAITAQ